jgi:integrase
MLHTALHTIRHGFRLLRYFLTDTPPLYTILEEQLGHVPETQGQRIRRRWERSRERATRQGMQKAA